MSSTTLSLLDLIEESLEAEELVLPVLDAVAVKLQEIAKRDDFRIAEIEELVLREPVITSELLRAANSPFYGGLSEITTIRGAVVRIGINEVVNLVLLASEKGKYRAQDPRLDGLCRDLWQHAVGVAVGAQWLARRLGFDNFEQECFIGGLVHDIGKLFIVRALDDLMTKNKVESRVPSELINEIFVTTHARLGARLLERWNLPAVFRRVAAEHHDEELDSALIPLAAVRLANQACMKLGIGPLSDPSIVLPATVEASALGARDILLAEMEIMLEDTKELAG